MSTWQLQQAKQHFSEVVRAAEAGEPQVITKHGRRVAVIIEYEGYARLGQTKPSFKHYLEQVPAFEELDALERASEAPREFEWA